MAAHPALEAEATKRVGTREAPTAALDVFNAALHDVVDVIQQLEKLAAIGELAVLLLGDEIDTPRPREN